jgi:hypothetical protein
MFDVRALPRVGPVAQRLEQGLINKVFRIPARATLFHDPSASRRPAKFSAVAVVCVHRLQPKHASPETLTSAGAKWREAAIKGAKKRKEKAVECNQCSERDTDISPSRKYL